METDSSIPVAEPSYESCQLCVMEFGNSVEFLEHCIDEHNLSIVDVWALLDLNKIFTQMDPSLGYQALRERASTHDIHLVLLSKILYGYDSVRLAREYLQREEESYESALKRARLDDNGSVTSGLLSKNEQLVAQKKAPPGMTVCRATRGLFGIGSRRSGDSLNSYSIQRPNGGINNVQLGSQRVQPLLSDGKDHFAFRSEFPRERPCECRSEMRVVADRTQNIEDKSLQLLKDLRAMLQTSNTAPLLARHYANVMGRKEGMTTQNMANDPANLPPRTVLKLRKPTACVKKPVARPRLTLAKKPIIEEITLSDSSEDEHEEKMKAESRVPPQPSTTDGKIVHLAESDSEEEKNEEDVDGADLPSSSSEPPQLDPQVGLEAPQLEDYESGDDDEVMILEDPPTKEPLSVDVDNWSSRFAKADWLLARDPVCGDDDVDFLTHPIEARTITSDELCLAVCRVILMSSRLSLTAIGLVVDHATDKRWVTRVEQDQVEFAFRRLCQDGFLTEANNVYTKVTDVEVLRKIENVSLRLADYALSLEEYETSLKTI